MAIEQYISNQYIRSLIILVGFFVISKIIVFITEKIVLRLTAKTETKVDDLIAEGTKSLISFILLFIGLRLAIISLTLSDRMNDIFINVVDSAIIMTVTIIIMKVISIIVSNWGHHLTAKTKSTIDDELVSLLYRAANVVIFLLGLLYVLKMWGFEITPLLASLGIGGIAIAFALQSSLGNIFGGISLIIDENIKVGQVIKIDDITSGKVVDIGFRSTKIESWDNEIIIVPNSVLSDSVFTNVSQPSKRIRIVLPFGVAYGSNVDLVKKIVLAEVKKVSGFIKEPEPSVKFLEMQDSALLFKAYFYVDHYDKRLAGADEANTLIYNVLNKHKISIPFPQMDIHIKEHKKGKGK